MPVFVKVVPPVRGQSNYDDRSHGQDRQTTKKQFCFHVLPFPRVNLEFRSLRHLNCAPVRPVPGESTFPARHSFGFRRPKRDISDQTFQMAWLQLGPIGAAQMDRAQHNLRPICLLMLSFTAADS